MKKDTKHILAKVCSKKYRKSSKLSLLKGCKRTNKRSIIISSKTLNKTNQDLDTNKTVYKITIKNPVK